MKKNFFTCIILTIFIANNINAASVYLLDEKAIETVIGQATELELATLNQNLNAIANGLNGGTSISASDPNPWVAFAVCWVVGEFGVHRHYLGTKSNMWALYTFTCCGIFGVVPFVDWIVLLVGAIKDDISKYVGNESFFMW